VDEIFTTLAACIRDEDPVALATVIERTDVVPGRNTLLPQLGATLLVSQAVGVRGSLGHDKLDAVVAGDATGALSSGQSVARHYGSAGEPRLNDVTVFIDVFAPPPRMIIFGAVDFTAALVKVAKVLGYHVTVCDAREVFATKRRFPEADDVVVGWPNVYLETVAEGLGPLDAICVLTHDHKFDIPVIVAALSTDVGYLGAMGSRKTHSERVNRLIEAGVDPSRLNEIMAPIGLAIGARTPPETAVAICAEIIARRANAEVRSLRDDTGPIHRVAS
jgi:xanthine dehydrogenase accessory factor